MCSVEFLRLKPGGSLLLSRSIKSEPFHLCHVISWRCGKEPRKRLLPNRTHCRAASGTTMSCSNPQSSGRLIGREVEHGKMTSELMHDRRSAWIKICIIPSARYCTERTLFNNYRKLEDSPKTWDVGGSLVWPSGSSADGMWNELNGEGWTEFLQGIRPGVQ